MRVCGKCLCGSEYGIDEGIFAVVNVYDNGKVSDVSCVLWLHVKIFSPVCDKLFVEILAQ